MMEAWFDWSGLFGRLAIAIALCADACSVTVLMGLAGVRWRKALFFTGLVGIFHAMLPLVGGWIGERSGFLFGWYAPLVSAMLLAMLGMQMIWNTWQSEVSAINFDHWWKRFVAALLVSVDALTIGFSYGTGGWFQAIDCFWLGGLAFLLSLIAWASGRILSWKTGRVSSLFGGMILLVFGIRGILKWN